MVLPLIGSQKKGYYLFCSVRCAALKEFLVENEGILRSEILVLFQWHWGETSQLSPSLEQDLKNAAQASAKWM